MLRVHREGDSSMVKQTDRQMAHHLLVHRSAGYSSWHVLSVSRYRYLMSFAAVAVLVFVWCYAGDPFLRMFCLFCVGVYTGAFLRDFGWLRRLKMNWPFTERVIDWKKVEEMAKLDE
jgi:hypothetical protein